MKWFDRFLYFIAFPIVCLGSILSPLTNDVRIFYGVEYLCWKYLPNFPSNINGFWEIKPIGSHIASYFLVVLTNAFIPFTNHFAQETFIKTFAVALTIVACYYFNRNVLRIRYGFLLCFFGIFCGLNLNILQLEFWAVIFSMFSCALFMSETKWHHYIAGSLLIWVLLFKGTTGCLIVSTICIVMIIQRNIDWMRGVIGYVVTGLFFFVASLTIWKTMLPDIFIAPILSHVGEYDMFGQIYVTAVAMTISMSIYIPIVGIGLVYGAVWLNKHRSDPRALWFLLLWIAPLIVVWLQSESFGYQYFVFVLPAIVSLVLYEKETPRERPGKKLKRENLVAATIVILFVMYCALYSPISKYGNEERQMNDFFWNDSAKINERFDLENQTILYLDTGSGPYYFASSSECRFVAPLIIQRANPNRSVVRTIPEYWDQYNCMMSYNNTYILSDGVLGPRDSWFGNDTHEKQAFIEKVNREYDSVHSGAWQVYKRKDNLL